MDVVLICTLLTLFYRKMRKLVWEGHDVNAKSSYISAYSKVVKIEHIKAPSQNFKKNWAAYLILRIHY